MKKLMFTAIALIAFSNLSTANTIADEEIVKKDSKEKIVLKPSCSEIWGRTRIWAMNQGIPLEAATCMAWEAWKACVGGGNIDASIGGGGQC